PSATCRRRSSPSGVQPCQLLLPCVGDSNLPAAGGCFSRVRRRHISAAVRDSPQKKRGRMPSASALSGDDPRSLGLLGLVLLRGGLLGRSLLRSRLLLSVVGLVDGLLGRSLLRGGLLLGGLLLGGSLVRVLS